MTLARSTRHLHSAREAEDDSPMQHSIAANSRRAVFISAQLDERVRVRDIYEVFQNHGYRITHDWTRTDDLEDKLAQPVEAGSRAKQDIDGVMASDVYILLSDNDRVGKGMYAELGAALAMHELRGSPEIYVVGSMNHLSIFYLHPAVKHRSDIDQVLKELDNG